MPERRPVPERRLVQERRHGERRQSAGSAVDVMRAEHENLFGEVGEILRNIRRMEDDLTALAARLRRIEVGLGELLEKERSRI